MAPNVNLAKRQGGDFNEYGYAAGRGLDQHWEGAAAQAANAGDPTFIGFFDHFLGDSMDGRWATDLSTGAAAAIVAARTGTLQLSTDTDDTDHATLALGLHWLVSRGFTVFEARVACNTAVTLRAVEIGVSDAVSETNGLAFSSHDATPVDVATNAAIFAINSAESVTAWSLLSVNAGGTPQRSTTTLTPVAGTFEKFKIVINAAGDVRFYINDVFLAEHELALATTALLTPWLSLVSLSGAIKLLDVCSVGMYGSL